MEPEMEDEVHPNVWQQLADSGWENSTLAALVTTEAEVGAVLAGCMPELQGRELIRQRRALWVAIQHLDSLERRKVRKVAQSVTQPRVMSNSVEVVPSEVYQKLLSENVELARSVYKSSYRRALKQEGADQRGVEELETKRWALTIAALIKTAKLPAAEIAEGTADPQATWIRLCGNRRARTLRQVARVWIKVSEWLGLAYAEVWPSSCARIIDYMEERAYDEGGHTMPGSVLSALQLMEAVGGVPPEARLGSSPLLNNVVKSLTKQLASDALPKKSAPLFTVAMVISAELLVVDPGANVVARILAFVFLVMIWCALRTDDVLWIDRSRFTLSDIGLRGVLMRSKTSGAGRRVRELPIFILRTTSLSGHDWLLVGSDLYLQVAEQFPGVQFLCTPRKDLEGFTRKYLVSATLMGWMHWLTLQLMVPRRMGGIWRADPEEALIDIELGARWSGHSARHCLPSWAAAIGIESERRAFVGRWKAGVEIDHNTYILTARQIVHGVQEEVLQAFCTGKPRSFLEVEIMGDLIQFAAERGIDREEVTRKHMIWRRRLRVVALFQDYPMITDLTWGIGAMPDPGTREGTGAATLPGDDDNTQEAPYWVSISRRAGFRRLHRTGGCSTKPESVHRAEPVFVITAQTADKKCQLCWKKDVREESSASSSGSSSSTEDGSDSDKQSH